MKRVFKYGLPHADDFTIKIPRGARLLSVQAQDGLPYLWALVDDAELTVERAFKLRGTGHPADECADLPFVGTFQLYDGRLVFHLFDAGEGPWAL